MQKNVKSPLPKNHPILPQANHILTKNTEWIQIAILLKFCLKGLIIHVKILLN